MLRVVEIERRYHGFVIAIACCGCLLLAGCGKAKPPIRDDDPEAVVVLKKAGAIVERVPNFRAKDMIGRNIDMSETSMEPDLLKTLSTVEHVGQLTMNGPDVTDESLSYISSMKSVTVLDLEGANVTDAGLKHLTGMRGLYSLNLNDTQVTGAGLAELPQVGVLQLSQLPIGDEELTHLSHLNRLKFLALKDTQVTPGGVAKLKQQGRPNLMVMGIRRN